MRLVVGLLVVLAISGLASADTPVDAGPAHLRVAREEPAACVVSGLDPCPAWLDRGSDPGVGDDTLYVNQVVRQVDLELDGPGVPLLVVVDLRNGSVPIDAFQRYHALHQSIALSMPTHAVDLDLTPEGIVPTYPALRPDGTVVDEPIVWQWDDGFVNYTAVHVPYTTYARSTDDQFDGATAPLAYCDLSAYIGELGCAAKDVRAAVLGVRNAIPDVVVGAEVDQLRAGTSASTDSAPLAASLGVRAGSAGTWTRSPLVPADETRGRSGTELHSVGLLSALPSPAASDAPLTAADSAIGSPASASPFLLAGAALAVLLLGWLYHRITGRRVIDHPQRHRIAALAREEPGLDIATVAARLGVSFKTAAHHVRVLQRAGAVTTTSAGRRVLVHVPGDEQRALQADALRHPKRSDLVRLVHAQPGIAQSRAAHALGTGRSTLHRHVSALVHAGLLRNDDGSLFPGSRP